VDSRYVDAAAAGAELPGLDPDPEDLSEFDDLSDPDDFPELGDLSEPDDFSAVDDLSEPDELSDPLETELFCDSRLSVR
jgi:hypothetical protein